MVKLSKDGFGRPLPKWLALLTQLDLDKTYDIGQIVELAQTTRKQCRELLSSLAKPQYIHTEHGPHKIVFKGKDLVYIGKEYNSGKMYRKKK